MKYILSIISIFILSACHFYNDYIENFEIQLPEKKLAILQNSEFYWILKYHELNGQVKFVELDKNTERIFVPVQKGLSQAFLLTGILQVNENIRLYIYPAGFIYPGESSKGQFSFDWDWSFESSLLFSLEDYIDLESLNLKKLFAAIDDRAEQKDHWIVDKDLILENLISRDFRIYDIRKKRERTVELNLPEGIWYNLNPLAKDIHSFSENNLTEIPVYTGFHSFYNKKGLVLEIDLKENGEYNYILY